MSDHASDDTSDHQGALTSIPEASEIDVLLADYDVQEVIGQGGMGAVYKAWQPRLGRHVAIKVLPVGKDGHDEFAESFRTEARTMANLHHSHIVTVHDFGEAGDFMYLVMEYVGGETLFHHLHEKTYTPEQTLSVILQVCDALTYAHNQNVIHRDIKSANILIGKDGMAKVVDFGLATLQAEPGLLRRNVQSGGPVMGTPGYSAPEILKPGGTVDHRADIYSLGVVLYEALTGRTMETAWTPPSRSAGTPPQLDSIIRKATKENPGERHQSVEQFAASLKQLNRFGTSRGKRKPATAQTVAAPVRGLRPAATSARKRPVRPPVSQSNSALPVIIGVLIALVVAVFFMLSNKKEEKKTPARKPGDPVITPTLPPDINSDKP